MSNILEKRCAGPCGQTLPMTSEFFHRNKLATDGWRSRCKECRKIPYSPGTKSIDIPKSHKHCYRCKGTFPTTTEFWYHNKAAKDGWHSECKECDKQRKKLRGRSRVRVREIKDNPLEKKQCSVCSFFSPMTSEFFYRSSVARDGWGPWCKTCRKKYDREREMNPDIRKKHAIYYKTWAKEHGERLRSYGRKHGRTAYNNRKARKKAVPGTHTEAQIQEQLKRQKYRCYYAACGHAKFEKKGRKYNFHVDHTFPLARVAGTNIPANDISYLVLACPKCNLSKKDKFPWEWPEGGRLL